MDENEPCGHGRGRCSGPGERRRRRRASAQHGVLGVISRLDKPTSAYRDNPGPIPGRRLRAFQDDAVRFFGQPVAVVVATTLEAAQHAADLVEVSYDVEQPSTDLTRIRGRSWKSVRRAEATERHNLSDPGAGREGPGTAGSAGSAVSAG